MAREMPISEVMTEGVIAVDKEASVLEAANLMEKEYIRGLIVTEDEDAVGVIVCRDIVYEVVAEGKDPKNTSIDEIMSSDLVVADDDEMLGEVARGMVKNNVSRVPVVRDNMLVGILTQTDIMRAWPGFAEIIHEQEELDAKATPRQESSSGVCEECENYSEDLEAAGGRLLCPECRSTRDVS